MICGDRNHVYCDLWHGYAVWHLLGLKIWKKWYKVKQLTIGIKEHVAGWLYYQMCNQQYRQGITNYIKTTSNRNIYNWNILRRTLNLYGGIFEQVIYNQIVTIVIIFVWQGWNYRKHYDLCQAWITVIEIS